MDCYRLAVIKMQRHAITVTAFFVQEYYALESVTKMNQQLYYTISLKNNTK